MTQYAVTTGLEKTIKRLEKLTNVATINELVVKATVNGLETVNEVASGLTGDIRAHSGAHRKRNPQTSVSDLVDTGAYRASWQLSFPGPYQGKVATNSAYALFLEEGNESMEGFHVARTTAELSREYFVKEAKGAIERALR